MSDYLAVGCDLRFVSRMPEFLDAEGQSRVKFAVLDTYVAYHVKAARKEFPKTGRYKRTGGQQAPAVFIPGLGMTRADTGTAIGEDGSASDNAFDEEKARNDAFRQFEPSWERWLKLKLDPLFAGCLPSKLLSEQATGIDWRKADGTKDHPVWASVPIETEPSKYDLVVLVLLAPNPIRV